MTLRAAAGPVAAVTGGTGFLGRYCVAALAAAGWHVRLLVRRDPTHPLLSGLSMELVPGDLADEAALSRLVHGASVVVHAAGATKARNAAAFRSTNRDATARLAGIVARQAPGCRFVHISSQAARCPALSPYAASKREGELALLAALGPAPAVSVTPWVVLRPCVIYGPWDAASASLLHLAAGRIVAVPGPPEPRLAMVHARDVADAVVAFCTSASAGRVYEICDASVEGHSWRDIVRIAAPAPPRFVTVPDCLIMAAGSLSDAWSRMIDRPMLFGRGKAREILHRDWRPDPTLQPPPELWTPRIDLGDGLRETLAWWRSGSCSARPRP